MAQNRESPRKKARVAMPTTYAPKTATRVGGGMLTNCYTEIGRDARVVKRPGMSNLGPVAVDCVSGQGTTFFNNDVVYVTCDVLKIGSCPSGLPVNDHFSVGDTLDEYAVYSSRTGLVWTANSNDSTVRVRNYTTKALVATIAPPAFGNHGSSGICYLPDRREFCVVQKGPLETIHNYDLPEGGPLVWFIDEDTRAITQVVKCQAAIANPFTWVGSPVYLQQSQTILLLWNNGVGAITMEMTHQESGWPQATFSVVFPADPGWVKGNTVMMTQEKKYASLHFDANLSIVAYTGTPQITNYTISRTTEIMTPAAYDSARRRLWLTQEGPSRLSYIDVSTDPPGALTDVATLPANMVNLAYDAAKDVLWAVSAYHGSCTAYKLKPSDGSVISSQAVDITSNTGQYWQFMQPLSCSVITFYSGDKAWILNLN